MNDLQGDGAVGTAKANKAREVVLWLLGLGLLRRAMAVHGIWLALLVNIVLLLSPLTADLITTSRPAESVLGK